MRMRGWGPLVMGYNISVMLVKVGNSENLIFFPFFLASSSRYVGERRSKDYTDSLHFYH